MDDGPASEDAAVALLRAAAAAGTGAVVATPHCSARFPTMPEQVEAGVGALRARLAVEGVAIELLAGAEVALEQAAALPEDDLRRLTLGGSSCLLLESPLDPVAGLELERTVDALQRRGFRVLLAHPERAPCFVDRPRRLRALVAGGVLCSITAAALEGRFGDAPRWYGLELLRDGLVHSVDSDAHDATGRPPGVAAGLAAAAALLPAVRAQADWLAAEAPAALLADEPLPPLPAG